MNVEFARIAASVLFAASLIPADAKAQDCPIPQAPQNYTVENESNTTGSSNEAIPNKDSSPLVRISWPSVPEAEGYNFRSTRLDAQTDQRPPDQIINNWPGNVVEVHLSYPLGNPQSYIGWVHSISKCGVSNPTGFTFEVKTDTNSNPKPSPLGSH